MISVIISSHNLLNFENISLSISKSIGNVAYEIIRIENNNKFSLTEAYNMGASMAKFDYLCFVHEDVYFRSFNWGLNLLALFNDCPFAGVVGVAGSTIKTDMPTGWATSSEFDKISIIQKINSGIIHYNTRPNVMTNSERVEILDGVFLFTSKIVWAKYKFDESLKGYHLYDIDFTLRVSKGYHNYISYAITIEHLSVGGFDDNWLMKILEYHNRPDKMILFSDSYGLKAKIRSGTYKRLITSGISFRKRIKYIYVLGIDFSSFFFSLLFLFNWIGKPIHSVYSFFKQKTRFIK